MLKTYCMYVLCTSITWVVCWSLHLLTMWHAHTCTCMCICTYMCVTSFMQGSDIGFLPISEFIPACDTQSKVISRLEYHIYRQCFSYDNLGEELLFDALQDMLNPLNSTKVGMAACAVYRGTLFNCEYLLIANCEFFLHSQLIDLQT